MVPLNYRKLNDLIQIVSSEKATKFFVKKETLLIDHGIVFNRWNKERGTMLPIDHG